MNDSKWKNLIKQQTEIKLNISKAPPPKKDNEDNKYRKELRKIIDLSLSNDKIIDSILKYTSKYEDNEILYITSTKWL